MRRRIDSQDGVDVQLAWAYHWEHLHAALDHGAAQVEESAHFDGTAEGHLAVSLAEGWAEKHTQMWACLVYLPDERYCKI